MTTNDQHVLPKTVILDNDQSRERVEPRVQYIYQWFGGFFAGVTVVVQNSTCLHANTKGSGHVLFGTFSLISTRHQWPRPEHGC